MAYAQALAALGDPTRRRLVERLRVRPSAVGELARHLRVSQPAVSQHLRVLRRARLVAARPEAQRRIYRLDPNGIEALCDYAERMWTDALESFARSFEE